LWRGSVLVGDNAANAELFAFCYGSDAEFIRYWKYVYFHGDGDACE